MSNSPFLVVIVERQVSHGFETPTENEKRNVSLGTIDTIDEARFGTRCPKFQTLPLQLCSH